MVSYYPGHVGSASKYGPKIYYQSSIAGLTAKQLIGLGVKAGGFGGAALVAVLFFASGIPRVQNDILKRFPGMTAIYEKKVHPQDNPF